MADRFFEHPILNSPYVEKWKTPWVLSDVTALASPVAYAHGPGAVTLRGNANMEEQGRPLPDDKFRRRENGAGLVVG